jgi:hypothetical protein
MQQVWGAPPGQAPTDCASGLRGLLFAVERARAAVRDAADGERAGMACRADARGTAMFREIDGLRYAEEHAVRYEAESLARQRRRAAGLKLELDRESQQR